MDLRLKDKTAFVSGSTQGIGFAVARALLGEGAAVVINGRSEAGVQDALRRLRAELPDADVSGRGADFSDAAQVRDLLASLGDLDILVNNVGLFGLDRFEEVSDDEWQRYFDVNVMSGVRLSRQVLSGMLDRKWGRILFISSESGVNVPADMVHYGVTKAAMIALGNGLSKLTRGTEVTVNTILGGPTYSDGVAGTVAGIAQARNVPADEMKAAIISANQTTLLQRFIEPSEIAQLVLYLASPLSAATNGAAVRADGGVLTTMI
ncbi:MULTISPECIES: SDR family NAD(P)-dependent oxidoreductase [Streptomyces]|uniref:Short chain dehydrogenase n=1 Tax=Streptomyces griseus subsp. griseus (strain JCM 4626 / CBS 651.72 / NBRC 13350 / KCC S-0626 / ISP 5235) TaxID=455632 RepID=B1VLX8_STRGG|nr:SDR family oxidoreductase [Streptomyces griseus]MBW3709754.1 SDR family NAD(P)-dependent oxidoreductase [Streptomyces griseus]SEE21080.1 NAD(P)-dependent dehydrogenase, short-chain alcohol dehydrogenase family [Streptomyces griseus]SQA26634.1 short chain dehydrogenase [Streptomyces griseus]BAG16879.1 putative short chain dehydrogenase [Streptomyces griseus subsp. griseus NBRC 13350]BAG23916.1 putative short chain dehydrogenase [Streptomyces griseus subsp. griseus NBRC 13350]